MVDSFGHRQHTVDDGSGDGQHHGYGTPKNDCHHEHRLRYICVLYLEIRFMTTKYISDNLIKFIYTET